MGNLRQRLTASYLRLLGSFALSTRLTPRRLWIAMAIPFQWSSASSSIARLTNQELLSLRPLDHVEPQWREHNPQGLALESSLQKVGLGPDQTVSTTRLGHQESVSILRNKFVPRL